MAFPTPQGTITALRTTADSTSYTPALPDGVVAGEGILVEVTTDAPGAGGTNDLTTTSAGFVRLDQINLSAGFMGAAYFWKESADGGGADSLVITGAVAEQYTSLAMRISGHRKGELPTLTPLIAPANSTAPDPPAHTSPGGAEDNLWIAFGHTNTSVAFTAGPAGYSGFTTQQGSGSAGDSSAVAWRQLNAATEDPGAFTTSASRTWIATTLVIRPEAAVETRTLSLAATASGADTAAISATNLNRASLAGQATGDDTASANLVTTLQWVDEAAVNNSALPWTLWGKDWRANVAQTAWDLMSWADDRQWIKQEARSTDVRSGDPADRHRSELSGSPFAWAASAGERWISYAQVYLQLPNPIVWTTLAQQFDLGYSNPSLKLEDRGDRLQVNIAGGSSTTRTQVAAWEGDRFVPHRLYRHVWRIKAHPTSGELDWWVEGVLVLSLRGVPIGQGSDPSAYEKIGVYSDDDALGMTPAEVITGNYESASGLDALRARIASPVAVPALVSALYPAGTAPTGTKLISDGSTTISLALAATASGADLAAVALVALDRLTLAATAEGAEIANVALAALDRLTLAATAEGAESAAVALAALDRLSLAATAEGAESAAVDLKVSDRLSLAATAEGEESMAGAMTALDRLSLAATASGADTAAIVLAVPMASISLAATASGAETAAGALKALDRLSLAATDAGPDSAAVSVAALDRLSLAATAEGAEIMAASLGVLDRLALAATAEGAETASAVLAAIAGVSMAAQAEGADTAAISITRTLNLNLAATAEGADTFSATLGAPRMTLSLAAIAEGNETASAALTVLARASMAATAQGADSAAVALVNANRLALDATASGEDLAAATLAALAQAALDASGEGAETFEGAATVLDRLALSATAAGAETAAITLGDTGMTLRLDATAEGAEIASGSIAVLDRLSLAATDASGDAAAVAIVNRNRIALTATAQGEELAAVAATVLDRLTLAAVAEGADTASISILRTLSIALAATASGADTAAILIGGVAPTAIRLAATAQGAETASASISVLDRLALAAAGQGADVAAISIGVSNRLALAAIAEGAEIAAVVARVPIVATMIATAEGAEIAAILISLGAVPSIGWMAAEGWWQGPRARDGVHGPRTGEGVFGPRIVTG